MITAVSRSAGSARICRNSVVFPLPRKPVSTWTGIRGRCCAAVGIAPLFNLEYGLDLHRHISRQRTAADGGAGMTSGVTEDRDHQVRGSVDYLGVIAEFRNCIHEPTEPDAADHAIEVAIKRCPELSENIDCAQTCGRLSVFQRNIAAQLADKLILAVFARHLSGNEHRRSAAL